MTLTLSLIFMILALACFIAAAFYSESKINLQAAGLALLTIAWLMAEK